MAPKLRHVSMDKDDLAWEENDNETETWERKIQKADIYRAVGKLILKYRPGDAVELHRPTRGGYNVIYRLEYQDGSSAIMRVPGKGV
jgi:hypothetical protein